MSHALYRLGRFAARRPWAVIAAWAIVAGLVVGASAGFGRDLEDAFEAPGLDSTAALDLLTAAQSHSAGPTAQVVLTPLDDGATFFDSADATAALANVQAAVTKLPKVLGTSDPAGALAAGPEFAAASGSVSPDGRVALIRVQYPPIEQLTAGDLENLKELAVRTQQDSPLQVELSGDLFFAFEQPETGVGEMIGLIAAVVILLLAFGSLIAMGLPIGLALFGLALGISSMSLITYLIEIPSWAPQVASMVGLGVGIDYALFVVTRHREFLARGMTVEESVGRAAAIAGQAVIFAGGTVVIAILGLAVAGVPFMTSAGVAISVTVLLMVVASITLLPAFLGLAGHRVNRFGIRRHRADSGHAVSGGWERWGRHVSNNAWALSLIH
ncbi:MAG: MMPL family transporter, partial [Actinomycetota bacterium]|nr:MMPL family transporter [Actinomycetota bacterium]